MTVTQQSSNLTTQNGQHLQIMNVTKQQDILSNDPTDYRERYPNVGTLLLNNVPKCNLEFWKKRLPIIDWLPKYKRAYFFADFVAGLTVGLTAIPQGIAYAVVAGLEPQYGLYSGFIGCFVYFIFGSSKDITIGPTAIMALMVQRYVRSNPDFAILSTFLSGVVTFLLGILNLGFLVQFISIPVTAGFTSAAAITIASSQIKSLLGLKGASNEFIDAWKNVFENILETRLWDTVLGITTLILLLILRKLKDVRGHWPIFYKYLSLSRNALAVIGGTLLAYLLSLYNIEPFILTGKVTSGFPPVEPPPFSTTVGDKEYNFFDMFNELGSSVIAIPLIAILENIAVAKAFAKGKTIDATQEMIALGLCNIFGSFFRSMPTTGSFTRTAINNNSGVETTLGGIFTGSIILLALGFLTETFYFIPKATLAAVILSAMFFMIEIDVAIQVWRVKRIDIIPFIVTLISCLMLGLEFGILVGIAINLVFVLYSTARPKTNINVIKVENYDILMITPDQSLIFSSAEYIRYKILKHSSIFNVNFVIINGEFVQTIDGTVASNLKSVSEDLKYQNKYVYFWNWKQQPTGVIWRLNQELWKYFKNTETLEELIDLIKKDESIAIDIK